LMQVGLVHVGSYAGRNLCFGVGLDQRRERAAPERIALSAIMSG
jgi:hypothetical protein